MRGRCDRDEQEAHDEEGEATPSVPAGHICHGALHVHSASLIGTRRCGMSPGMNSIVPLFVNNFHGRVVGQFESCEPMRDRSPDSSLRSE